MPLLDAFSALGCAHIMDDELEVSIPMLVLPWTASDGLARLRRLPDTPFGKRLRRQSLGANRFIAFDQSTVVD